MTEGNHNPKLSQAQYVIVLVEALNKETDRACAVLAIAYLDHFLKESISQVLQLEKVPDTVGALLFGRDAALSSFAAKIDIAATIRLLSDNDKRDLHIMRKIRNDFAHELLGMSFNNEAISNRCRELYAAKQDGFPSAPREQFMKALLNITISIFRNLQGTEVSATPPEISVSH